MPVEDIVANGYNLDIKNLNVAEDVHEDPAVLLEQYLAAKAEAEVARAELKAALQACLE